jgi:hypothetical protein
MAMMLNYVNFFRESGVECPNLVITCVDFRFRRQISELLSYSGCRDYDNISLPGASKSIIDQTTRDQTLQAIETCHRLHSTTRLAIIDHIDCGAYGGSAAFAGPEAEETFHIERLTEASEIVRAALPIEVVPMYIDWRKLQTI